MNNRFTSGGQGQNSGVFGMGQGASNSTSTPGNFRPGVFGGSTIIKPTFGSQQNPNNSSVNNSTALGNSYYGRQGNDPNSTSMLQSPGFPKYGGTMNSTAANNSMSRFGGGSYNYVNTNSTQQTQSQVQNQVQVQQNRNNPFTPQQREKLDKLLDRTFKGQQNLQGHNLKLDLKLGERVDANTTDFKFPRPPCDTVSHMEQNPIHNMVAVSAWDGSVSLYEIVFNQSSRCYEASFKARRSEEGCSFLHCDWNTDGRRLTVASTDGKLRIWDVQEDRMEATDPRLSYSSASSGVRSSHFYKTQIGNPATSNGEHIIINACFDKKIRVMDLRNSSVGYGSSHGNMVFNLQGVPVCTDYKGNNTYLVATSSHVNTFSVDLNGRLSMEKSDTVDMGGEYSCCILWENRFPAANAPNRGENRWDKVIIGNAVGRVGVVPTYSKMSTYSSSNKFFSFLAGKVEKDFNETLYPINTMLQLPRKNYLVVGAASGIVSFVDINNRKVVKSLNQTSLPVTALTADMTEHYLVYALGYDWTRGYEYYDMVNQRPAIFVRTLNSD